MLDHRPSLYIVDPARQRAAELDAALEGAMKDALNSEPAELADASQDDRLHALVVRHREELALRGLYVGKVADLSALHRMAEDVVAEVAGQIERAR